MTSSWTKDRTLELIERYRAFECLWRFKSKHYSNKSKREKAYDELVHFVKTFQPDANRDTVVAKIANLRCSWRKEHKKVIRSQLSGAEPGDMHEPSLFYFENLKFISDSNAPYCGKEKAFDSDSLDKNIDSKEFFFHQNGDTDFCDDDQSDVSTSTPSPIATPCVAEPSPSLSPTLATVESQRRQSQAPTPTTMKTTKRKRLSNNDELSSSACSCQCQCQKSNVLFPCVSHDNDEFLSFGQTVMHTLRNMPREQRIHAKKLISDVMYEGQMNNLSRASTFLPVPDRSNNTEPS